MAVSSNGNKKGKAMKGADEKHNIMIGCKVLLPMHASQEASWPTHLCGELYPARSGLDVEFIPISLGVAQARSFSQSKHICR